MPVVTEEQADAGPPARAIPEGVPLGTSAALVHRPEAHRRRRGPRARPGRADPRQRGSARSGSTGANEKGLTSEEREEMARLRREVKRLTMERDLLKRSSGLLGEGVATGEPAIAGSSPP